MRGELLRYYWRTPRDLRSPVQLVSADLSSDADIAALRAELGSGGAGEHVEVVPDQRPAGARMGAVLWLHGGGHIAGSAVAETEHVTELARAVGAVVLAVDYRLAPEHPFPAGLEDAYAALADLVRRAPELGVDTDRIVVAGASAGGGLAAALCQLARDRGEHRIAGQVLRYPMLDDRTLGQRRPYVWSAASNRYAWARYLARPDGSGAPERGAGVPPTYAVPARTRDLTGLPPTWIGVGDADLFHPECVSYARRLAAAGVAVTLHEVPGMYHGAEGIRPDAAAMVDFVRRERAALRAALA